MGVNRSAVTPCCHTLVTPLTPVPDRERRYVPDVPLGAILRM